MAERKTNGNNDNVAVQDGAAATTLPTNAIALQPMNVPDVQADNCEWQPIIDDLLEIDASDAVDLSLHPIRLGSMVRKQNGYFQWQWAKDTDATDTIPILTHTQRLALTFTHGLQTLGTAPSEKTVFVRFDILMAALLCIRRAWSTSTPPITKRLMCQGTPDDEQAVHLFFVDDQPAMAVAKRKQEDEYKLTEDEYKALCAALSIDKFGQSTQQENPNKSDAAVDDSYLQQFLHYRKPKTNLPDVSVTNTTNSRRFTIQSSTFKFNAQQQQTSALPTFGDLYTNKNYGGSAPTFHTTSVRRVPSVQAGVHFTPSPVHGFLDAVHLAFCHELGLVLDPAHVWLMITQAVALRMQIDPVGVHAALGVKTASASEKQTITIRDDSLNTFAPDGHNRASVLEIETQKWAALLPKFVNKITQYVSSPWTKQCTMALSTSTPTTQAAQAVTLMDSVKQFFEYRVQSACGIAYVDLRGTRQDWQLMVDTVANMRTKTFAAWRDKALHEWLCVLQVVLMKLVESFDTIDASFWRSIYTYESESGGYVNINGWTTAFLPFRSDGVRMGEFKFTIPKKQQHEDEPKTEHKQQPDEPTPVPMATLLTMLPRLSQMKNCASGISRCPFVWDDKGTYHNMWWSAGFMQPHVVSSSASATPHPDPAIPCLEPTVGWLVHAQTNEQTKQ